VRKFKTPEKPIHSDSFIRENHAHWKLTLLFMSAVLVTGIVLKMDWTPFRRWSEHRDERKAVDSIAQAMGFIRVRNWNGALDAAVRAIQEEPESTEAYHIAGAAAGQIYGLNSKESRSYYERFIQLEPDPTKKAFVKEIFPDLKVS
jgi:hypothetical protein